MTGSLRVADPAIDSDSELDQQVFYATVKFCGRDLGECSLESAGVIECQGGVGDSQDSLNVLG